jgi:hypothetical protein
VLRVWRADDASICAMVGAAPKDAIAAEKKPPLATELCSDRPLRCLATRPLLSKRELRTDG